MERFYDPTWRAQLIQALGFATLGMLIGVGQLLASAEVLTIRIVVGRALSTAGLAMAAGAALPWMPQMPLLAEIGIAATLASLGTSGLERLFQRILRP